MGRRSPTRRAGSSRARWPSSNGCRSPSSGAATCSVCSRTTTGRSTATPRTNRPSVTSSRSARAATSASSCGTKTAADRCRSAGAPTGSTTATTTAWRRIPSFATRSGSTASFAPTSSAGWKETCVASADLYLHRAGVLDAAACARWVAGVYAARADWTPCFEGVQFTLGRAYYAIVERALPALQARVRGLLGELVGAPVTPRPGWCGPGVHIFPAGDWLSQNGGDVHFDTEGLREPERAARLPALSAILMLQPPRQGGGLRVWDALW